MVHDILEIEKVAVEESEIVKFTSETAFTSLSTNLLIEAGSFVCVAANLYPFEREKWNRDEAILCGHLVRLYKLICGVLDQTTQQRRETSQILSRLAFECIVNLRYLLKHASSELFSCYVEYSLKHERRLRGKIIQNIQDRGGSRLKIENRMLLSIERSFNISSVDPDIVTKRVPRNWGNKNIVSVQATRGVIQVSTMEQAD